MGPITKRRSARAVTPLPTGPRHGSRGANARQTVRLSRICAPGPMALHRFSDHTETLSTFSAVNHHALIVISAALGGCVLLLAVLLTLVGRRSKRRADERVGAVVQTLEKRMDELAQELAGAVERAEEEGRRSRFLGEIGGSIDMDEVLARTLEAGTGLDGVDAALVRLENQDGIPTVAAHGLSADGAEAIAGPPDGSRARAIEVSYRYG